MTISNKIFATVCFIFFCKATAAQQAINKESFSAINLNYPGLQKVSATLQKENYEESAKQLLAYFRSRKAAQTINTNSKKPNHTTLALADDILLHKFKPHKGYGTFDYGKDINWQYRPVKDQLVTTFLHRTTFWQALADVYLATGDEKYAKEWIFQMQDWMSKNPQGGYADDKDYAWKAFVVSFRLNNWASFFNEFVNSPHFTPQFLMEFLKSYNEQAQYVMANYTAIGNHRLYEAEHLLLAGTSFPEMAKALIWRKSGVNVLNEEISKQVYPDGVQFELSPSYHIGTIGTFLRALKMAKDAGIEDEFPKSYRNLVEKMVIAVPKFSFPDYTFPLYGNSFLTNKSNMLKNYQDWANVFSNNEEIKYFATDGKSGKAPKPISTALPNAGFYAFRNGWNMNSTVMQIKAGPPAEFHSHPDNGNFELWIKGRNFTPDAGSFVYANVGEQENVKRDWYRSTKAHQTLTLDNKNLENNAKQLKWQPEGNVQILTYTNPSYKGLDHQRSFIFVNHLFFIIIDKATGTANGKLGIHFNLKEDSNPSVNEQNKSIVTTYTDNNNLLIQNLNKDKVSLSAEESFVSYEYQKETPRPAFVFEQQKPNNKPSVFISILYPFTGTGAPTITLSENAGNDYDTNKINLTLKINGKELKIQTVL